LYVRRLIYGLGLSLWYLQAVLKTRYYSKMYLQKYIFFNYYFTIKNKIVSKNITCIIDCYFTCHSGRVVNDKSKPYSCSILCICFCWYMVQAFLKKWWVESDFKAPILPLSLPLKGSGCHYNSIDNNTRTK
jgi:hypothetical protein